MTDLSPLLRPGRPERSPARPQVMVPMGAEMGTHGGLFVEQAHASGDCVHPATRGAEGGQRRPRGGTRPVTVGRCRPPPRVGTSRSWPTITGCRTRTTPRPACPTRTTSSSARPCPHACAAAPKFGAFIVAGALVGIVVAVLATVIVGWVSADGSASDVPSGQGFISFLDGQGSIRVVMGVAGAVVGGFVGGALAARADRRSRDPARLSLRVVRPPRPGTHVARLNDVARAREWPRHRLVGFSRRYRSPAGSQTLDVDALDGKALAPSPLGEAGPSVSASSRSVHDRP